MVGQCRHTLSLPEVFFEARGKVMEMVEPAALFRGGFVNFFGSFFLRHLCIPKHKSRFSPQSAHAVHNAEIDVQCIAACGHMHPFLCHQLRWARWWGASSLALPVVDGLALGGLGRCASLPRAGQLSLSYPSPPSLILVREGCSSGLLPGREYFLPSQRFHFYGRMGLCVHQFLPTPAPLPPSI